MTVGDLLAKLSQVKDLSVQVVDGFGWPISTVIELEDQEGCFVQINSEEPEVNLQ